MPSGAGSPDGFSITHSVFSAGGLLANLLPDYDIGRVIACRLLQHNQNDTYLVRTTDDSYVLRIYQARGMYTPRTLSDISYEVELLDHLACKGIPVARPVVRRDGGFVRSLSAPEGSRHAVLFTYAHGELVAPNAWDAAYIRRFGRSLANLHVAAADFTSRHARFALDFTYLLDVPLQLVQPLLAHRPNDWAYVQRLADHLRERIGVLVDQGLHRGVCHGDALGKTNTHVTSDGTISFYDFECCGPGWLAYDIGVFGHTVSLLKTAEEADALLEAFVSGYQDQFHLGPADLAAIPYCIALRQFWLMGLRTGNWENWGEGEVSDQALTWLFDFWHTWEERWDRTVA